MRIAPAEVRQANQVQQFVDTRLLLLPGEIANPETDVVSDRQMGEEREVLEDHAHLAFLRRQCPAHGADRDPIDLDDTRADRFETRDCAKQRGFTAATRAKQTTDIPLVQFDENIPDDLGVAVGD